MTVTQIRYNISMCISQTQKWTHMWSALCCFVTCQKNSMTNYILCLCLARVLKDTFYSSYHWFLVLITNSKVKKSISIKYGPALISFVYYAWYWSYSLDHLWKWSFPGQKSSYEISFRFKLCFCVPAFRVSQNQVGQNFTFVLTDIESKQRFGFCRLTSGCRVCICLLRYVGVYLLNFVCCMDELQSQCHSLSKFP